MVSAARVDGKKRLRVLVVDDNLDQVHTLAYLLKDLGHHVDYAINGTVALDLAKRVRPQIVLLDIRLPDVSGLRLAKYLRGMADLKLAFLVGITGYDLDEREAQRAGFDCVLQKPVTFQKLESVLSFL